ncbi:MAG: hypothetical protein WD696_16740 [Bryobacteraceae bacterium]
MKSRTLTLLFGTLALALTSFAADITGKWTAMVPGRNGEQETTFTFKQQGDALTGTVSGRQGERPIVEGKVTGDAISFSVESQRGKQTYSGTISGGEIKFKREGGPGQPREFTAKKAQS